MSQDCEGGAMSHPDTVSMTNAPQQKRPELGSSRSRITGRIGKSALALSGVTVMLGTVLAATAPGAGSTAPSTLVTPKTAATPNLSGLAGAAGLASLGNADSPLGAPATSKSASSSVTAGPGGDLGNDTMLTGTPATVSNLPQPSDGKSDCGGVTGLKPSGTRWVCTFDDEFDGTTLNTSKWLVQQTSNSGYHSGNECYVNSPNNVSVANGVLSLTARQEAAPFSCTNGLDGSESYQTSYTAGMVSTDDRFSQDYGLYMVRAKLPASTIKGLQETLWLWPNDASKYGSLPQSGGEIDFAEFYSEYPNLDIPVLHYRTVTKDPNATADCNLTNPNEFHTYGLEWNTTSMTMFIDGQACMSDTWQPMAPESAPEPFNQPFFICLTQALGMDTNNFVAGTSQLPATTQIDWVRVWS
jgi:beta-glucanase (GH16 family)